MTNALVKHGRALPSITRRGIIRLLKRWIVSRHSTRSSHRCSTCVLFHFFIINHRIIKRSALAVAKYYERNSPSMLVWEHVRRTSTLHFSEMSYFQLICILARQRWRAINTKTPWNHQKPYSIPYDLKHRSLETFTFSVDDKYHYTFSLEIPHHFKISFQIMKYLLTVFIYIKSI